MSNPNPSKDEIILDQKYQITVLEYQKQQAEESLKKIKKQEPNTLTVGIFLGILFVFGLAGISRVLQWVF